MLYACILAKEIEYEWFVSRHYDMLYTTFYACILREDTVYTWIVLRDGIPTGQTEKKESAFILDIPHSKRVQWREIIESII